MTPTLQTRYFMVRFSICQHVRSYLLVFLAHKEQVQVLVLHTRAQWTVLVLHTRAQWTVLVLHTRAQWTVVLRYVTPCVPVLLYFEITNTQSYTNQTVPEAFFALYSQQIRFCTDSCLKLAVMIKPAARIQASHPVLKIYFRQSLKIRMKCCSSPTPCVSHT